MADPLHQFQITPIIPISDDILIMPLIGALDSVRATQVIESLLQTIVEHGARFMIIDITGIAVVDTAVAHHLLQAARAIQLLGAQIVLVGIDPSDADVLAGLIKVREKNLTNNTLIVKEGGLRWRRMDGAALRRR
mgnify:CR=1 FL=1